MRILLGVVATGCGAVAFLAGWATLFLLSAGGSVPFFGIPLTLPGAIVMLVALSAASTLCLVGAVREPHASV